MALSGKLLKLWQLASLAPRRPVEFFDRTRAITQRVSDRLLGVQGADAAAPWDDTARRLADFFDVSVEQIDDTSRIDALQRAVRERMESWPDRPFDLMHNADNTLLRLAYLTTRLLRPNVVVETGVGYGVTTTAILTALDENGHGHLHSVDLPPLSSDGPRWVGRLVPDELRGRWTLHRGVSARILPRLLPTLDPVDVAVQDSLFTRANIRRELTAIDRHLNPRRSAVVTNGVQLNPSFQDWAAARQPELTAIVAAEAKDDLVGICLQRQAEAS